MRRTKIWLFAVLLGLGVSASARAEPDDDRKAPPVRPGSTSTLNRWLRGDVGDAKKSPPRADKDKDKSKDKDKDKDKKDAKKPAAEEKSGPSLEEIMARERERAKADYLRRLEACLRLMQIAEETKDESLRRAVEQLDQRVLAAYQDRLQRMPESPGELDEEILEKHLGQQSGRRNSRAMRDQNAKRDRGGRTAVGGSAVREEE